MNSSSTEKIGVITDTSCLIILEKIGFLELLHQLFPVVLTSREIASEYGNTLPEWVVIIRAKNQSLKEELSGIVDKGEASAIALAH